MSSQQQSQQEQIKALERQLANRYVSDKIKDAIAKKLEALKTNKPVTK